MRENDKKPFIRFAGFTDDWEQRKLGDITNCYSGGTPSVGNKMFYGGSIPFIRSGEISSEETALFLTEDGLKGSSAKMVEIGDILYALYGATSGEVSISRISGAINQAILAIKPLDNYSPSFIMQWLRKEKENIIGTYLQGGQGNLSGNIVKELMISIPGNKTEQDEIGKFFANLDNLITLHQRKYDKLVVMKKSMMEKMFPQNGSDVPEIRFEGFTDPWEQYKIGEVLTEKKNSIELEDNKTYELVTVRRRNEGVVSRGLLKGKDILVKNYYEIKSGDFIISKRQVVHGANGIVPQSLDKAIVSNEYLIAIGNESISTDFWTLISKLPIMYKKFFLSSYGVDIEKLVFDVEDWKKRTIVIPRLDEQKKITEFFNNLDNLISLQQRKQKKLKNIKKSMLEKMFV